MWWVAELVDHTLVSANDFLVCYCGDGQIITTASELLDGLVNEVLGDIVRQVNKCSERLSGDGEALIDPASC